jgi:hypothetical protein
LNNHEPDPTEAEPEQQGNQNRVTRHRGIAPSKTFSYLHDFRTGKEEKHHGNGNYDSQCCYLRVNKVGTPYQNVQPNEHQKIDQEWPIETEISVN